MNRREIGKIGEEIATGYLVGKGFKILEMNWGSKWGEVDLICKDRNVFVFVEVKAKIGDGFGRPEDMVTRRKLYQVRRMASVYTKAHDSPKRIDVVAVVLSKLHNECKIETINHYTSVY